MVVRTTETPVCVLVRVTLASGTRGAGRVFHRADHRGSVELRGCERNSRAEREEQDEQTDTTHKQSHAKTSEKVRAAEVAVNEKSYRRHVTRPQHGPGRTSQNGHVNRARCEPEGADDVIPMAGRAHEISSDDIKKGGPD